MKAKMAVASPGNVPVWQKYGPWFLLFFVFLLFANTLGNGYNMDDELVTRKHKLTSQGIKAIPDIFTSSYYSDEMGYAYGYRPIVLVSFAVEKQIFGEKPAVSHFFNLVFYALLVLVFFRFLTLLFGNNQKHFVWLATLLFAVHPIHVEVVASIKNRDEILALLFALLAGISYIRAFEGKTILRLLLVALLFTLAMLSKRSVYPLVAVFPVCMLLFSAQGLRKIVLYALPLILPAAFCAYEGDVPRLLLLLVFPVAVIGAVSLVKMPLGEVRGFITLNVSYILWAALAISWTLFGWGIWQEARMPIYIGLAISVLVCLKNGKLGVPQLIVYATAIAFFRSDVEFARMSVVLSAWYAVSLFFGEKKNRWQGILFLLSYGVFIYGFNEPASYGFGIACLLLAFVAHKKFWIGLVLALAVALFDFLKLYQVSDIQVLVPAMVLIPFLGKKQERVPVDKAMAIVLLSVACLFYGIREWPNRLADAPVVPSEMATTQPLPKENVLTEGRKLEYAENTLVAPHTRTEQAGTGLITLLEYTRLHVFPYELSFYYGYAYIETSTLANPWVWVSLLVHVGLLVLAFYTIRRQKGVALGVLWYLLSIGLFSNWLELVAGMVGERLAFTASAGFCILLAALVFWIKPQLNLRQPKALEIGLGLIILAFGFRTLIRNADWKDSIRLMSHDIEHLENSAQANNLYALHLMQSSFDAKQYSANEQLNMRKLAVTHFDRALQIWPGFFNAAYDKGRAALMVGDVPAAIDGFEKAADMRHNDFMDPNYQLSQLYLQTGRYPQFLANARRIFEVDYQKHPEAYSMLARGFYLNGKSDSAKISLKQGLVHYPGNLELKKNLGEVFKAEGKPDSVNYYMQ